VESDVSDPQAVSFGRQRRKWSLVAPYLTLMDEGAPQRRHSLRELFNGLRYVLRRGIAWCAIPIDPPPCSAVYQRSQRWLAAGLFEALAQGGPFCASPPDAPRSRSRRSFSVAPCSTPKSGPPASYDGAERKRGSTLHMGVDTLQHLLALHVTLANVDARAEVGKLAAAVQEGRGESVKLSLAQPARLCLPRLAIAFDDLAQARGNR
jgi:transposase